MELPEYRFALPTEAQWEYTCRAGTTTEFYFGDDASKMDEYAFYEGNMNWPGKPGYKGKAFYHDVGVKKPNSFGLYDMHGGVWEWCSDWYSPDYYFDSPLVDPGERPIRTWRKPVYPDRPSSKQAPRDDDPVMHLDWNDCMAFCDWLSRKEVSHGFEYSLPTSAEWEYACRADTTTVWYFGDEDAFDKVGHEYEWISWRGRSPRAVDQGKPKPFGLYDMHGNMMEWMADWLHDYYYLESPLNDPPGPDNMNEERNKRRMVRGGAFEVGKYWSRSSWYVRIAQGSNQHRHPGFRVAMHIRDVEGVAPAPEPDLQIVGQDKTPADPVAARQAAVAADRPRELQIRLNGNVRLEFVLVSAGSFLIS